MSSEFWKEKRVHSGDVISAWIVVLIEVVVVLVISGISSSISHEPKEVKVIHAASTLWLH
jgi:hypothetical protein